MPGQQTHADDDEYGNPHGERADVVQPFADVESDHIQQRGRCQRHQRKHNVESRVRGKMRPLRLPHEENIAGREVQHGREVGQVRGPVSPSRHEAGKVAKSALRPNVEAAFIRIARRKLNHRERKRRVKGKPCADPDDDRAGSGRGRGGNPAQADAGDYIEEHQVAKSHDSLRAVGIFGFGDGDAGASEWPVVFSNFGLSFRPWVAHARVSVHRAKGERLELQRSAGWAR